jgi:acetoin utilization deacetylase AcuC-like enzyme
MKLSIGRNGNFPFHKEHSNLDIALPDGSGDGTFLEAVRSEVTRSVELAQVDLAIYIAGADSFMVDRLGRLAMSKKGWRSVAAGC